MVAIVPPEYTDSCKTATLYYGFNLLYRPVFLYISEISIYIGRRNSSHFLKALQFQSPLLNAHFRICEYSSPQKRFFSDNNVCYLVFLSSALYFRSMIPDIWNI